jgi:hypothetical protein
MTVENATDENPVATLKALCDGLVDAGSRGTTRRRFYVETHAPVHTSANQSTISPSTTVAEVAP